MSYPNCDMTAVSQLAWAIFYYEGGNRIDPSMRNVRNNNPGNLRPYMPSQIHDSDNYRVFPSVDMGWSTLISDIIFKLTRHLNPGSTMLDFFNLYAPAADHNNPHGYAQFVCRWLSSALKSTVTTSTPIVDILFTKT